MKILDNIALILSSAMIVASLFFKSVKITFSVFAGAVIAFSSYKATCFIVKRLVDPQRKSKIFVFMAAFLKVVLLAALLWYAVNNVSIDILAFLAGLSTMVFAVTFYGLAGLVKDKHT